MDLENLPKALQEIKDKLLIAVIEEAAPAANAELIKSLNTRIQQRPAGKDAVPNSIGKALNQQQQKFLKEAPVVEQQQPISIVASKQNDKYVINATGNKGQLIITDADIKNYRKTISEQAKKSLDDLL